MSFRKKHIKNKINRIKPKKPIFKKKWFWFLILLFLIILICIYLVFFYSEFKIKYIEISGNTEIGSDELKSIILSNMPASIFLVNANKIENKILQKFLTIENASLSKKMPKTLVLTILERKPIGAFCNPSGCFLIDKTGNIFSPLPIYDETDVFIIRDVANNRKLFVGETVLDEGIIDDIIKIGKNLKDNQQINLKEAVITSPVRLNIKTNENWQVYFDIGPNSDANSQLTKLNLLLNTEISQESRKNLRYINLIPKERAIICDNAICGEMGLVH